MMSERIVVPSVSVSYASNGSSTKSDALGMRPMQERAFEKRGEQYKFYNQGLRHVGSPQIYLDGRSGPCLLPFDVLEHALRIGGSGHRGSDACRPACIGEDALSATFRAPD